ncbi:MULTISPECIES: tRNA dihydrouridine synthase DusB [Streptomyces]|uniref:tRNA dihydrouridine synthase DusB n=1 Tax=Streptomyces TaxID=1883 RepID=UPI0004C4BCA4|nr:MULTISPECIES: tRNA dihydrouridine synthase DusB [Streptomyces]THA78885.1 tRNA dihydrouridine synthase DusB [Streptomyces sp. LRa12]WSB63408.1 tRNA dihydrouridine synthase DusB [Streptomyces anthocyanicus]WTC08754.1 tRNA dihydrouridine synthase DusB [Streptomyces anthocyanicus]WTE21056.1 tRNA dihydrouridine synthase DusB [Streptomyces anthocyanicus]GGL25819.1 tRNA dihydrouridine synthase DusB [Streptomyces anthocyanicus]
MSTLTTSTPHPTAAPLRIGPHTVAPPVVLAPMAGITNAPFRTLCREFSGGKGLFVSEMITTRALVERNEKTMQLIHFDATETPRSIQLYGVDPVTVGKAVRMIAEEGLADHIDLNFGCPVPKVTRKGGGSALPYKRHLLRAIVREAVTGAGDLPVTMKMRKGLDDDHLTYLDAGRIAVEEGVTAIALHGRTTAQHYGGTADWDAIARLKEHVPEIPVLGNGDIWSAEDALRMVRETGCDGVVVGRGCLGRPWLFADLVAAFEGRTDSFVRPTLREVADVMVRHATLLGEWIGNGGTARRATVEGGGGRREGEARGVIDFRKHVAWYLKGFAVGSEMRKRLAVTSSLEALRAGLDELDLDQPWPAGADGPRGRTSGNNRVVLPDGWLKDPYDCAGVGEDAELDTSGG